jgi:hypothetical protein
MNDEESQVRAVLRELCDSQLVFSSGTGQGTSYRAASEEDLATLQKQRGNDGADELIVALMYREAPLTLGEIAAKAQLEVAEIEPVVARLLSEGRIQGVDDAGEPRYRAGALLIPFGAPVGWEAAIFDHFKALVTTILCKLRDPHVAALDDVVGGSTYTIDVWDDHPLAQEVYGALARVRRSLGDLRTRVQTFNETREVPDRHTRVVIYAGQCLIQEDDARLD